ncbi:hypothetical protein RBSWK_00898 [Rhodopirellula baltica SWK14]|uniref:Uncharacterized protein n=1 Tax=Rhodopirellula baltica SWK14 TaxID=993516 RepID=L7CN02_RHOBT|nr:hypothetical protein RBSWK_00898 [Rhodopirellula baltica SWK14]
MDDRTELFHARIFEAENLHERDQTREGQRRSQTADRLQRLGSLPGIVIEVAGTTRCKIIGPR